MADVFDIYDLLPHLNCGKCPGHDCMKFANLLAKGEANPESCSALKEDEKRMAELKALLAEEA